MTARRGPTVSQAWRLAVTAGLSAALFAIRLASQEAAAPKPPDAPLDVFSAGRARRILGALVGDGLPHPQGSRANAVVRERVIAEMKWVGLEPSIQERLACGRYGTCGTVRNVLATLPGSAGARAVLLCAHYDSVGAGPGASDDGMGVAALLEVARILKTSPPMRNLVVFLIDDGEESGLLGAEAFVSGDPLAKRIGAVVNPEARGTSGASLLFETSERNLWLVRLAAEALPRPNTSSVFSSVYRYMPNDTDLTVFRENGLAGVNFACVGDVGNYHTPRDDIQNASLATLQEHGDNALAMARALGDADLEKRSADDAVFFDVFGLTILWWPEGWTPGIAGVAALLLLAALWFAARRRDLSRRSLAWGLAGGLGMLAAPIVLASAALRALEAAGACPSNWIASPLLLLAGFWLLSFFGSALVAAFLSSRAGVPGLWAGVWIFWTLAGLALSFLAPGLSFPFLIPALAAALTGPPRQAETRWRALLPILLSVFFWLPMAWVLYDGLGLRGAPVISAFVALVAGTLAPTIASLPGGFRRRFLLLSGALSAAALLGGASLPAFSVRRPERANILWHQDADTGRARWLYATGSNTLAPVLRATAPFGAKTITPFPWSGRRRAFAANASHRNDPAPELTEIQSSASGGRRRFRARLLSPRSATTASLAFPPSARIESFAMAGELLPRLHPRAVRDAGGWQIYSCVTLPPEGIVVEAALAGEEPVEIILTDQSPGLPEEGAKLSAARPPTAVPTHEGDLSLVTHRVRL